MKHPTCRLASTPTRAASRHVIPDGLADPNSCPPASRARVAHQDLTKGISRVHGRVGLGGRSLTGTGWARYQDHLLEVQEHVEYDSVMHGWGHLAVGAAATWSYPFAAESDRGWPNRTPTIFAKLPVPPRPRPILRPLECGASVAAGVLSGSPAIGAPAQRASAADGADRA